MILSKGNQSQIGLTYDADWNQKQSDDFDEILYAKAKLGKYLMEKY